MVSGGMTAEDAVAAGGTTARPQVRVIPPPNVAKEGVEVDDLPGPPLEVLTGATNLDLPAIPDFAAARRAASDARPAVARPIAAPAGAPAVTVVKDAPLRKIV